MNAKLVYVAIAILALAIGFGIVWFFSNSLNPMFNRAKYLLMPLYMAWMKIPSVVRNIIQGVLTAVSSALAGFFAWTKILAMKKLRETQQQASQTTQQMEGMKEGVGQSTGAIVDKVSELKDQVHVKEEAYGQLATAYKTLEGDNKRLVDKIAQMRLETQTLQSQLKTLQYELKLERGEIPRPVA